MYVCICICMYINSLFFLTSIDPFISNRVACCCHWVMPRLIYELSCSSSCVQSIHASLIVSGNQEDLYQNIFQSSHWKSRVSEGPSHSMPWGRSKKVFVPLVAWGWMKKVTHSKYEVEGRTWHSCPSFFFVPHGFAALIGKCFTSRNHHYLFWLVVWMNHERYRDRVNQAIVWDCLETVKSLVPYEKVNILLSSSKVKYDPWDKKYNIFMQHMWKWAPTLDVQACYQWMVQLRVHNVNGRNSCY